LKISKFNGKSVITSDAYSLGEVYDIHCEIDTWKITHLAVDLTKEACSELGYKKPLFGSITVCLPIRYVTNVADVITLKKTLRKLKDIEQCDIK
jgi:sporulation protein YlmC with PRC-barrel domain